MEEKYANECGEKIAAQKGLHRFDVGISYNIRNCYGLHASGSEGGISKSCYGQVVGLRQVVYGYVAGYCKGYNTVCGTYLDGQNGI